jgi:hypothetical protein
MVIELRSYRGPKPKKCFLAVSQGCFPLKPVKVKASDRRNADARTAFKLPILNVSSLERLRTALYHKETTQEVVSKTYSDWVSNNQYMIFEQKRHHSTIRQIASLIPKRENPKYAWKVRKRWQEFTLPFEYQQKIEDEKGTLVSITETTTNVLFLSLTWDISICDWKTAWDSVSYFWNLMMANLRRKYGRVLTARVYESSKQGYPHIHCILYFPDNGFPTFLKWSKKQKRHVWRIPFPEVEKLRNLWHSFIDVQGMVNLADGLKYLGKYVTKGTDLESDDLTGKGLITLANTWAFRKRAYSLGVKFKEAIFQKYLSLDLTRISITQTVSEQMTLENKLLRDSQPSFMKPWFEKWTNKGIVEKPHLKRHGGIPKGCFSFGLCDKQKQFIGTFFGTRETKNPTVEKSWIFSAYAD